MRAYAGTMRRRFVGVGAVLLAACGPDFKLPVWFEETSRYALESGGTLDSESRLFVRRYTDERGLPVGGYPLPNRTLLLVLSTGLPQPVVLDAPTKEVFGLPRAALTDRDGGLSVADFDARRSGHGTYTVSGGAFAFEFGGRRCRIVDRPPLVGWVTFERLRRYRPDSFPQRPRLEQKSLAKLRAWAKPVHLDVYFTDRAWSDDIPFVANVGALANALQGAPFEARYCALPRDFEQRADERPVFRDAVARRVGELPYAILTCDGVEQARLTHVQLAHPARFLWPLVERSGRR